MKTLAEMREDALSIYRAALAAADPRAAVLRTLSRRGSALIMGGQVEHDLSRGRVIALGAGKAGAPMAQAVEEVLGDAVTAGAVVVKYGHTAPTRQITLYEAGHPLPDENGLAATGRALELLTGLTANDLVLCLISGGGSALFEYLVEGVTLDDLRTMTQVLLHCGATINEINALRKHISQVKGGQLARLAYPARVVSLILSDVLGSPLDVIASGPTAPDSTTFEDALAVIDGYRIRDRIPHSILAHLEKGARGELVETVKAGNLALERVTNLIVADNTSACEAAVQAASALGYATSLLSTTLQGEARVLGEQFAEGAHRVASGRVPRAMCLIGGGEPTVKIRGKGKGGRAQEFTLAAAIKMAGLEHAVVLSAGTDGTDGPTDAAGAVADGTTVDRARLDGLDPQRYLEDNDSYTFFQALGDLVITGPTNTNVNDLMILLLEG